MLTKKMLEIVKLTEKYADAAFSVVTARPNSLIMTNGEFIIKAETEEHIAEKTFYLDGNSAKATIKKLTATDESVLQDDGNGNAYYTCRGGEKMVFPCLPAHNARLQDKPVETALDDYVNEREYSAEESKTICIDARKLLDISKYIVGLAEGKGKVPITIMIKDTLLPMRLTANEGGTNLTVILAPMK